MAYFEIVSLISEGATVAMDPVGQCEYLVYNSNQWVGYDNPATFALKIAYLKSKGMGGISVWAMDADTTSKFICQPFHVGFAVESFNNDPSLNCISLPPFHKAFNLTNSITTNLYNKQGWLNNVIPTNGTTFSAGSKITDSGMLARVIVGVAVAIVAGFAL